MNLTNINGINYLEQGSGNTILWIPGRDQVGGSADLIYKDSPLSKFWITSDPPVKIICLQLTKFGAVSEMVELAAKFIKDMNIKPLVVGWSYGGAVTCELAKKYQSLITGFVSISMADINDSGMENVTIPAWFAHDVSGKDTATSWKGTEQAYNACGSLDKTFFRFTGGGHWIWKYMFDPNGFQAGGLKGNIYERCNSLSTPIQIEKQWYINGKATGVTDEILVELLRR